MDPLTPDGGYLTGPEIERWIVLGRIEIEPFDPANIGPNGYDLHLGDELFTYSRSGRMIVIEEGGVTRALLPEHPPELIREMPFEIGGSCGWLLHPDRLYLGSTLERTLVDGAFPRVGGRSSLGRLGVTCHLTAGDGDDGFNGRWTLEITCVEPVVLRPGGRYFTLRVCTQIGERMPYRGRYQHQNGVLPCLGGEGERSWR